MQRDHLESLRLYPPSNQAGDTSFDRTSQSSLQESQRSHARQLSQAAADQSCSLHSENASNRHHEDLEAEMDVSPTTPPGRSTSAGSPRPPDAPRKAKPTRSPIQLSPHAPVRKLDFDNGTSLMRPLDREQSCDSHHSGPGRG